MIAGSLESAAAMSNAPDPSRAARTDLLGELGRRRMLPLVGAYVGGLWLVTEILAFAIGRYGLAPRLLDAVFLAAWLLLPAWWLVAWRIGAPGDAVWQRRDRWLIAANVAVVAIAGVLVWRNAPVDVAPVAGDAAPVPAAASVPVRRTVLLMPLQADPALPAPADGEPAPSVLIPELVRLDLWYGLKPNAATALGSGGSRLHAYAQRLGATVDAAPLAVQRQIATELRAAGFLAGRIVPSPQGPRIDAVLYGLAPERELERFDLPAAPPWDAADRIAAALRRHFGDDGGDDPPARAASSESLPALHAWLAGRRALADNAPERALPQLQEAWRIDPSFAQAGIDMMQAQYAAGRFKEARATLDAVMQKGATLPEPMRLMLRAFAAQWDQDDDSAQQAYELWAKRYPIDPVPQRWMAQRALMRDALDPSPLARLHELTASEGDLPQWRTLADWYRRRGQPERAVAVLREALERFGEDVGLLLDLAEMQGAAGDLDAAQKTCSTAALLRPDLVRPLTAQAIHAVNAGDHAQALRLLERAARLASTPGARLEVLNLQVPMLAALGRLREAGALFDEHLAVVRQLTTATGVIGAHYSALLQIHAELHGVDATAAWLEQGLREVPAEYAAVVRASTTVYLRALAGDRAGALAAIDGYRDAAVELGSLVDEMVLQRMRAEALAASAHDREALDALIDAEARWRQAYATARSATAPNSDFLHRAADVALTLGDLERAHAWLAEPARSGPGDPATGLGIALLAHADGDDDAARAALQPVLAAWKDADAGYAPLQRARELEQRLAR